MKSSIVLVGIAALVLLVCISANTQELPKNLPTKEAIDDPIGLRLQRLVTGARQLLQGMAAACDPNAGPKPLSRR